MPKTTVMLAKALWTESSSKDELRAKISEYMARNYPSYQVLEIHKHHAICYAGD